MKPFAYLLAIRMFTVAGLALGAQGPAGTSGACSHVLGPVDQNGMPIGFTCEDVGGRALLVWNAAQIGSNISITGGIRAVSFYPGAFSIDGSFTSNGPLAFIGGSITINGSITGTSVLIAGASATANDIKTTLLGPGERITSNSTAAVNVEATGKLTATTGNVVIAGSNVTNRGQITAKKGSAILKAGTILDVGWSDVSWIDGVKVRASTGPTVFNYGNVVAKDITLEAHRFGSLIVSVRNQGTLNATDTVTLVSGSPGTVSGSTYAPNTFGILNVGNIYATKVTVSPYFVAVPGGTPTDRSFAIKDAVQRKQLQTDIGGKILIPNQDNTPASTSAAVIDSTQTTTSTIVIPQLAPSMTHLNATSQAMKPMLVAANSSSEQVRGASSEPITSKPKPRVKAKPVLVRGAFFDSKISAVISPNP